VSGPVVGSGGGSTAPGAIGPDAAQIAASGRHAPPALLAVDENAVRGALSLEEFVGALRQVADRERIQIGGAVEFDPLWRCWSMTPESNLGGLR